MRCYYIGLFDQHELVGCAISQFLDMSKLESFGSRENCFKENLRTFVFRRFSSKVVFVGNNMLSGENAFHFTDDSYFVSGVTAIASAVDEISSKLANAGNRPHLTIWKDFRGKHASRFPESVTAKYFRFTTQPSMVFDIRPHWKKEADYVADFSKKYRDQYKRARKKTEGIDMRQISCDDVSDYEDRLYELYRTVSDNAPFNTFYLQRNHWKSLKKNLGDNFLLYGYFDGDELIGFDTLIKNGNVMETYFLGYDGEQQKQRMLYLNMLYNMIGYAIKNRYKTVIFARTALEIKSSVGADPLTLFGFMKHSNKLINRNLPKLFRYFEPETQWQQRHPFKTEVSGSRPSSDGGESSPPTA